MSCDLIREYNVSVKLSTTHVENTNQDPNYIKITLIISSRLSLIRLIFHVFRTYVNVKSRYLKVKPPYVLIKVGIYCVTNLLNVGMWLYTIYTFQMITMCRLW